MAVGVCYSESSHTMNEFLKMDIFFFVTTGAVVLLTGAVLFMLWRIAQILKHLEHISEQVSLESDTLRADLAEMRSDVRKGKGKLKSLFSFFSKTAKRASK